MTGNDTIRDHYQAGIADQAALLARLATILDEMDGPLTAERLGAFDQFHVGGLAATAELARHAGITRGMRVLDAGSGLGGPSRYLAETFGCDVDGVDLAPAYVAIATFLADRAGLAPHLRYQPGSITALPFPGATFDLVWTQHVVMNIPDRTGLYQEFHRVLKPGGRLAFYDPCSPDAAEPPHYPVPWADTPATSTLLTKSETLAALEHANLRVLAWDDVTQMAASWIAAQQAQRAAQPANGPALNLGLVVGPRMGPMVANFARNIAEGRVRLAMGLCERV